jgi:hypothetical protein
MENEIDEIQNINQEKEVSIIDIEDLWGDPKFEELANLVINKKKDTKFRI